MKAKVFFSKEITPEYEEKAGETRLYTISGFAPFGMGQT